MFFRNNQHRCKSLLNNAGYEVKYLGNLPAVMNDAANVRELDFQHVLSRIMHDLDRTELIFIQIGAFDGITCDPIHHFVTKYRWRGILLEPQPEPYRKLLNNYAGYTNLLFKNAAVGHDAGKLTLYTVNGEELPDWCGGLASFTRKTIEKHEQTIPSISELIHPIEVLTVTFNSILDELATEQVDLLQVDVEGFDADVIRMFPFDRVLPRLIHFERKHLNSSKLNDCLQFLLPFGYKFAYDGDEDIMAIL